MSLQYFEQFQLALHKPSDNKLDIGYRIENIAITLVFRDKAGNNSFLLFARQSPNDRIPKGILKTIVDREDALAAQKRAEYHFRGICRPGAMGPFFLEKAATDAIFICDETSSHFTDAKHELANFSGGNGIVSLNMPFNSMVQLLQERYGNQVHICSLRNAEKFRAHPGVQKELARRKERMAQK